MTAASYPVLITDEVDPEGVALLVGEPELDRRRAHAPKAELLERIGEYDAFCRPERDPRLRRASGARHATASFGRAGVGSTTSPWRRRPTSGIAVINAPAGNTVAVAELFYGVMIALVQHLPRAFASMREGRWDRSDLLGTELKGKTLAIVGVGRIGGEIATRAHAFQVGRRLRSLHLRRPAFAPSGCGARRRSTRCS